MVSREEKKRMMRERAEKAMQKADQELSVENEMMLSDTSVDLNELKPIVADKSKYDELIMAVNEATMKNETVVQLQSRLIKIGLTTAEIAKVIAKFKGF